MSFQSATFQYHRRLRARLHALCLSKGYENASGNVDVYQESRQGLLHRPQRSSLGRQRSHVLDQSAQRNVVFASRSQDERDWKASELRSWLLFHAAPCLKDVLHDRYLSHFLFVYWVLGCSDYYGHYAPILAIFIARPVHIPSSPGRCRRM